MLDLEKCGGREDWSRLALEFCQGQRPINELVTALESTSPAQRLQQQAGYVLLHVHRACPGCLATHLDRLVSMLSPENIARSHISLLRQVFSVFQDRAIPEEIAGLVFAAAVETFLNRTHPIAARARALDCASNVATQYAGLWEEVLQLAQGIDPQESPGIQSMVRRVAKQAQKALAQA